MHAIRRDVSQGFWSVSVYRRIGVDMEQRQQSHGAFNCESIPLTNISPLKCRVTMYLARRPGNRRRDVRFRLLASGLRGLKWPRRFFALRLVELAQNTPEQQLTSSHAWSKRNSLNRTTY